eukprot:4597413-Ditylum_brightwellii.AAC.1
MVVPRKPWPFGDEWHSIACDNSRIIYRLKKDEGKDEPREKPCPRYIEKGKTASLMLRMSKPLYGTGKLVVLNSGFCVLQGIIELKKKG